MPTPPAPARERAPRVLTPGAPERVHFLDDQRRHRRASWKFTPFALAAVTIAGIPLCVVVTPALYVLALVAAHLVNAVAPLPAAAWEWLRGAAHVLPAAWAAVTGSGSVAWGRLALLLVAPGAVLLLAAWVWIRARLGDAAVSALLARLGAREPDPADLREQRLVNVVHELAVAAGVHPPRVLVADADAANIVAVGRTIDAATVVATRGLLNRLDRYQTQVMAAHVIASVGNGDLRIASLILSVFQAWGLVALLIEAPLSRQARDAVRSVWRATRSGAAHPEAAAARVRAAELLLGGAGQNYVDFMDFSDSGMMESHPLYGCFVTLPLLLTLGIASIAARSAIALFTAVVAGPWLAALWRTRRRLADAGAVQLTRNPEALARAVRDLSALDVAVPGGAPASFLFPVWATRTDEDNQRTDVTSFVLRMHLPLEHRLARIHALGAPLTDDAPPVPRPRFRERVRAALPSASDLRELALWLTLLLLILAALFAINLATTGALLLLAWTALQFAFVTVPRWVRGLVGWG